MITVKYIVDYFKKVWAIEHRVLETELTPDQWRERLEPHVESILTPVVFGSRPLRGVVRKDGFTVTKSAGRRKLFEVAHQSRP